MKVHPERITKEDKKLVNDLDYNGIEFPVREKYFSKSKKHLKTSWFSQFTFQIKNLKTRWICCLQLMMLNRIMCTSKILTDLCSAKQKIKTKSTFVKVVYSALVVKMC